MNNAGITNRYAFGSFRFDAATGELRAPGRSIKLRCQAALALDLLLSRRGEIVSRRELREALWPDERVVSFEASIAAVIRELRRALGDDSRAPRFIETIPKRGYRFIARSVETEPVGVAAAGAAAPKSNNRGGFLRISVASVLALMVLLIGDAKLDFNKAPDAITVAVLPFEGSSKVPERQILAKALPRELVGWLGTMAPEHMRVIDRIGAEKGGGAGSRDVPPADFVILGSVRDDGGAAVISAKLLSGNDGSFAWGENYRRDAEDAGLTAREVATRIADGVAPQLLPQWRNGSAAVMANAAAADAFRRGTEALAQLSPEGTIEAVDAFREAIELDPEFSAAHAHLAEALISWIGPALTADRVEQARQAAQTSIELVPTNAVGQRVLGEIGLYYDRDWQAAESRLERSIELSPSDASGHDSYAAWLSARGRHGEALREIDLGAALDPASVAISIDAMLLHYYARDFEGTISAARRLKKLWPGNEASHRYIVLSRLAMGDVAAAAAEARTRLAGGTSTSVGANSVSTLPDSEALEAYWTASLQAVARYVNESSGDPAALAMIQVQLGRLDAANDALEAALAGRHFSYFLPYLGVSPAFDRMCGHPGFESILRRLRQSVLSNEGLTRCAATIANSAPSREGT